MGEDGNEHRHNHPTHEEHHGRTVSETVLCPCIDDQAGKPADKSGVGEARLPFGGEERMTLVPGLPETGTPKRAWNRCCP